MLEDLYNRQTSLSLHRYTFITVVGIGGIGSWVALNLALSGCVGHLYLIDDDIVESTNLNRTPFRICDIGEYKVNAMKYLILERRTNIEITNISERTNEDIIKQQNEISSYYDNFAIIDCRDQVLTDLYDIKCKWLYKVGYDGSDITIDSNPQATKVISAGNGYRVIPSFICPAQLAANLVVSDLLYPETNAFTKTKIISFDSKYLLKNLIEGK